MVSNVSFDMFVLLLLTSSQAADMPASAANSSIHFAAHGRHSGASAASEARATALEANAQWRLSDPPRMIDWPTTRVAPAGTATRTRYHPPVRITVVGAGVVGLTTALVLEKQGHEVRVVASALGEATTSAVA